MAQSIKDHDKDDPLYASDVAAEARRLPLSIHARGSLFKRVAAICIPEAAGLHNSRSGPEPVPHTCGVQAALARDPMLCNTLSLW